MRKHTKLMIGLGAAALWIWYTKKNGLTLMGQPAPPVASVTQSTNAALAAAANASPAALAQMQQLGI